MKRLSKVILGILILAAGIGLAVIAFKFKPEAKPEGTLKKPATVRVVQAEQIDFQMSLPSQGLVEPRKKTAVAAEVGGKISEVSEKFKAGGEFNQGEMLVQIDRSDYEAAEAQAEANVADADLELATEEARAEQAKRDWERLGRSGQPSELTLRVPHMKSAEKKVEAAKAALKKAVADVERTTVTAPFSGRIESIHTEEGAYLAPGSPVAEFYATAPYEVRLPLSVDDWTFLRRDENGDPAGKVTLMVRAGGETHEFTGEIVRSEGVIDRESRSFYLIAEFGGTRPAGLEDGGGDAASPGDCLIQPGLFVKAAVEGKTFDNVVRVPVESFRNLDEVMVIESNESFDGIEKLLPDREYRLRFEKVKVLRRSLDEVLVTGGIEDGWWLSKTELSDMIEGMVVMPDREETPETEIELVDEPAPKP